MQTENPVQNVEVSPQVAPPSPPAPPSLGALTSRDLSRLRAQRSELSSQLNSATDRRSELVQQLSGTDGVVRAGLEARIRVLDTRILQLEQDIATTGQAVSSSPALGGGVTRPPVDFPVNPRELIPLAGIIFVAFPIALAMARLMWRRGRTAVPVRDPAADQRLERIEQAVDAIAIEVERIGESQRFNARLLAQGPAPDLRVAHDLEAAPAYVSARPDR